MEHVSSADGTAIAYQARGQGPALILVVGAFSDHASTATLAAGLAGRFTVYEYDRRGRGQSGDQASYAIEREVEDLGALIGAIGQPVLLFGHSSGGALVLETAATDRRVSKLVVHEPPYYPGGPSDALAGELAGLVAAGQESEAAVRFLKLVRTPAPVIEQMRAGRYWVRMTAMARTLPYEVRLARNGNVPVELCSRITAPALVLAGGASPPVARQVADTIAAAAPHGTARVLDGQGHGVADDVLIPVLTEFFG